MTRFQVTRYSLPGLKPIAVVERLTGTPSIKIEMY